MPRSYKKIKFLPEERKRMGAWLSCMTCHKEFYVYPERLKRKHKPQYCSMKCYNKKGDNNPFWGKRHTEYSVLKMTQHPNRHRFKSGEDNPNFVRFGKQSGFLGNSLYWWKYHKDKKSVVCERCGYSRKEVLVIHHADRNPENNDLKNIEILCPNCHSLEHFNSRDGNYWKLTH